MLSIMHNMTAMNIQRQFDLKVKNQKRSTEKLASGYKINRAADDAAGLSISEKMRCQIRGLKQGSKNVEDGISFLQTGEGVLGTVHQILDRMEELAVQAANDTNAQEDREAIQHELEYLRDEINHISRTTEFNGYKIFETGFAVNFTDNIVVVGIFDANNGDPNELESYGGIIINGSQRVPWNDIAPDMIYTDSETGKQMFHEGRFTYNAGSYDLIIDAKEGTVLPDIKVSFQLYADENGITAAGTSVPWSKVVDDNGNSILDVLNGGEQYFHFPFGDATGSFSVSECQTIDDVIYGINLYNTKYERLYVNEYDGYYRAKGVDILTPNASSTRVTNNLTEMALANGDTLNVSLGADEDGIWVKNIDGSEVAGSKKTWAQLGLANWTSGTDVSDQTTYEYTYSDDIWNVSYQFDLLNETSKESVIDGINQAVLSKSYENNHDEAKVTLTSNDAISGNFQVVRQDFLSVIDKAKIGRDFDQQTQEFASEDLSYNAANQTFSIQYKNAEDSSETVLELYSRNLTTSSADLQHDAKAYTSYLTARQVQALIKGSASEKTLSDVLGTDKVTTSGHLTELLERSYIESLTKKAGTWDSSGTEYASASLDFSGLGTDYDLYDLLGTGFNSTCNTCERHYSVMFTYFDDDASVNTTNQGYRYAIDGNPDDSHGDMLLEIDINSLIKQNVNTGEDLTNAIIDIIAQSRINKQNGSIVNYAWHNQSYAADGAKLYVCEKRTYYAYSNKATFDTEPYDVGITDISFDMYTSPTNNTPYSTKLLSLAYEYNMKNDISAEAEMLLDSEGEYVKDGTGYRLYVASDYYDSSGNLLPDTTEPERYSVTLTNNVASWDTLYNGIMNNIANMTQVSLQATDYDYVHYSTNEQPNSATASTFDYRVEDNKKFWIQSGANAGEGMYLQWDCFNAYTLGLGEPNVMSHESSGQLMSKVQGAITKISEIRAGFGAYTNRLEHTYNNNRNYEENLQDAESRIRDTDMPEELVGNSKHSLLIQAGQSLLAQANQQNQSVLQLLQ